MQLIFVANFRDVGLKVLMELDYHESYIFKNITKSVL